MVYDALHNVLQSALGDLDPSFALQDFTAKDAASSSSETILSRVIEALNTPPFLVDRRVVVVRDAQLLLSDEVAELITWIENPAPSVTLILGVVGTKANKLVKAAGEVVETNVGSRAQDRAAFVASKFAEYNVTIDRTASQRIAELVGDDVARIDSTARTLSTIYGSAPLKFKDVEPYLGEAGDVPAWDLTDAIDSGDASKSIVVARRMLDSKGRAGLQIVNMLQRHYLAMARLEGSGTTSQEEAGSILSMSPYPAGKALKTAQRLGPQKITQAVHWVREADVSLKGGVSYGGKDLNTDIDVTDLTVIEVLVARLARMSGAGRR